MKDGFKRPPEEGAPASKPKNGSRDLNTPKLLASSNTKASRFFFTSVTKAPLKEPTDDVMNTTMDKAFLGTLLMDDPGGDNTMDNKAHITGLWLTGMDGA